MDFRPLLARHIESKADITLATTPVDAARAGGFGLMKSDADGIIHSFVEKPKDPAVLATVEMPANIRKSLGITDDQPRYEASMGIYLFNRDVLIEALDNTLVDFGKHIIPDSIQKYRVLSYPFPGYWEDIGTIRSFFEANLDLAQVVPQYDFFDSLSPIYTHARFLPATKINAAQITRALLSDGCIITEATIDNCILGVRTVVEGPSVLKDCVVMGADYYRGAVNCPPDKPFPGIGRNCKIERAIIDKNVHIGDGVVITPEGKDENYDHPDGMYYIRDGIVVIPKNSVVPAGTWI
jgi:glucose-1-phosphate adenylyltransferase